MKKIARNDWLIKSMKPRRKKSIIKINNFYNKLLKNRPITQEIKKFKKKKKKSKSPFNFDQIQDPFNHENHHLEDLTSNHKESYKKIPNFFEAKHIRI